MSLIREALERARREAEAREHEPTGGTGRSYRVAPPRRRGVGPLALLAGALLVALASGGAVYLALAGERGGRTAGPAEAAPLARPAVPQPPTAAAGAAVASQTAPGVDPTAGAPMASTDPGGAPARAAGNEPPPAATVVLATPTTPATAESPRTPPAPAIPPPLPAPIPGPSTAASAAALDAAATPIAAPADGEPATDSTSRPAPAPSAPAVTFGSATTPGGASLELGGIAYSASGPVALVNGKAIAPGEGVVTTAGEAFLVESIEPDRVTLVSAGVRLVIRLR